MRQKNSSGVDGGPSGGLSVRSPGSEVPHQRQQKFCYADWLAVVTLDGWLLFSGLAVVILTVIRLMRC